MEKDTKFLLLEDAINEVFFELAANPDKWYDIATFSKVYSFLTKGNARPGTMNSEEPFGEKRGIWFKAKGEKRGKFISTFDFKKLAVDIIPKIISKQEDIAQIYEWTMWVRAFPGKGENGENGIHVETEMEKFHCTQCGNCCINLSDAFQTTVEIADINRWESEERWDILEWVEFYDVDDETAFGDIWINPKTGEDANRCPWLRKLPKQEKYKCRIHNTKPAHCRNYPKSKKHALTTGCKGFGEDLTLERVRLDLENLYRENKPDNKHRRR